MDPVLEVRQLCISFHTNGKIRELVHHVGFDLCKAETLGIVGESGSGKTLTALSLLRLLPPGARISGGSVFLYPEKLSLLETGEEKIRDIRGKRISMVFQEPMTSLNPSLRCGFQLTEALRRKQSLNRTEAREACLEWLHEVQLRQPEKIYRSYPHELSGGQRQRLMIAMAACTHPNILIADEPTTALDVTVQKSIGKLFASLQEKYGMGILFITHDLGLIADIAHRLVVMQNGQVVEQGKTEEILTQAVHPYTKGLIACRPRLDRKPLRLPTVREFMEEGLSNPPERTMEENRKRKEPKKNLPPLLEVKDLKVWFPVRKGWSGRNTEPYRAVKGVSFEVYQGETLGLVGESGCGKTSLGRSLMNLITSCSGEVLYKGKNTLRLNRKEQKAFYRNFQIIFQDPYSSLNPRITIGDAIMEPMKVHKIHTRSGDLQKAMYQLLEKVKLDPSHAGRFPHEFSGGQRQRIGIARILALKPEFIICDESVSSLDVSVQAEILNLLNSLKEEMNLTYIFISHDLSVVKYMSDRVMVMQNGKLVENGDAETVFSSPQHPYTLELIRAIPGQITGS